MQGLAGEKASPLLLESPLVRTTVLQCCENRVQNSSSVASWLVGRLVLPILLLGCARSCIPLRSEKLLRRYPLMGCCVSLPKSILGTAFNALRLAVTT